MRSLLFGHRPPDRGPEPIIELARRCDFSDQLVAHECFRAVSCALIRSGQLPRRASEPWLVGAGISHLDIKVRSVEIADPVAQAMAEEAGMLVTQASIDAPQPNGLRVVHYRLWPRRVVRTATTAKWSRGAHN
jgi:hypothetical protein